MSGADPSPTLAAQGGDRPAPPSVQAARARRRHRESPLAVDAPERTAGPGTADRAPRRWWLLAVGVYLLTRLPAVLGFLTGRALEGSSTSVLDVQRRWDGWWYLYLAESGYPPELNLPDRPQFGPWGFFPAWPAALGLTARLLGVEPVVATLVLTTACGAALAVVLRRFAAHYVGDGTALLFVALVLCWPGSVVLSLPYTETAFLLCAVAALDALVRERWVVAALAVFGACCIRSTGVALLAAAAVQLAVVVHRRRTAGRPAGPVVPWAALLPLAAGAAGFAVSFAYAAARTGRPLIWLDAQEQWGQRLDLGAESVRRFGRLLQGTEPDRWHVLVLALSLGLFALLALAGARSWRLLPPALWAWSAVLLALALLYSNVGPRPRMLLPVVPVFLLASVALARWHPAVRVAVLVGLTGLSFAYAVVVMTQALHVVA